MGQRRLLGQRHCPSSNFLREIASHGFLAIANGGPNGSGSTTSQMLTQSIDWAVAENSRQGSKYYGKLDTSKIAVAGFSCGGLEAYAVSNDPRITTTAIFSSGLLNDADDYQLRRLTKPIAYFVGGPSDIAYPNAIDDWGKLPSGLPAFMGNLNVGHGGTYGQTNGGEFGRVAVLYLKWRLKGDTTAGANFVGPNCGLCRTQWGPAEEPHARRTPPPTPTPHSDRPHRPPTPTPPHPDAHPPPGGTPGCTRLLRPGPVDRRLRRQRHRHRGHRRVNGWRVTLTLPGGATITSLVERRQHRHQRHRHRHQPELQRAARPRARAPASASRAPAAARSHRHLHRQLIGSPEAGADQGRPNDHGPRGGGRCPAGTTASSVVDHPRPRRQAPLAPMSWDRVPMPSGGCTGMVVGAPSEGMPAATTGDGPVRFDGPCPCPDAGAGVWAAGA